MLNMSHFKLKWVSAKEKGKHNNVFFKKKKDNDRATLLTFSISIHFSKKKTLPT